MIRRHQVTRAGVNSPWSCWRPCGVSAGVRRGRGPRGVGTRACDTRGGLGVRAHASPVGCGGLRGAFDLGARVASIASAGPGMVMSYARGSAKGRGRTLGSRGTGPAHMGGHSSRWPQTSESKNCELNQLEPETIPFSASLAPLTETRKSHPLEGSCQEAIPLPYPTFDSFFRLRWR